VEAWLEVAGARQVRLSHFNIIIISLPPNKTSAVNFINYSRQPRGFSIRGRNTELGKSMRGRPLCIKGHMRDPDMEHRYIDSGPDSET